MHTVIEDIIKRKGCTSEDKRKALASLSHDIEIAKGILDGKYKYCTECGDYYLSQSFFRTNEEKEEMVCTYSDPINSGGDEYERRKIRYFYINCPKGHQDIDHKAEV